MTVDLSIFNVDPNIVAQEKATALLNQLARLIAKENVTIIEGKFRTASFDTKNRTMYLPLWKNVDPRIKLLFRVHEIGHALYTPHADWHAVVKSTYGKALGMYANVVEDDRVDRMQAASYPGISAAVKQAAILLFEDNFFGVSSVEEAAELRFIDRLNLSSKLGTDYFPIQFSNKTEQELYIRFKTTKTFDEVVELAKDILAYSKTEEQKEEKTTENFQSNVDDEVADDSYDGDNSENTEEQEIDSDQLEESFFDSPKELDEELEEESTESASSSDTDELSDDDVLPQTQESFEQNEEQLTQDNMEGYIEQSKSYTRLSMNNIVLKNVHIKSSSFVEGYKKAKLEYAALLSQQNKV